MDKSSVAVAACERSQRRAPPPVPKAAAPWLVFPYGKGMKSQAFYNICDPNNSTTCRKSIPELRGKSFWQKTSHRNWLIIVCKDRKNEDIYHSDNWNHGDCFLWNPVSLEHIPLPSLLEWISKPKKYVLVDCVLTSPPNRRYQDDSMVIFLFSTPFEKKDDVLLLCCLPGDKQWNTKKFSRGDIAGDIEVELISLHCVKGKLYVTFESPDRLLEIEQKYLLGNNVKIPFIRPFELVYDNTKFALGEHCTDLYYVESDDEMFQIWVCYNVRCKQVMSICVWRLDFSRMQWEEMNELGDLVILAGTKTGFCCSAAKLGLTSGGLYYRLPDDQSLYKFQGNGGNAFFLPCLKLQTPWFTPEWLLMMPEDGRKRMENSVEEQQPQHKDFLLKEVEGNKTCAASNIIGSHDKHSVAEISPWDALNEDSMAAISTYLHPLDYVHFRSVCKANRRVMPPTTPKWESNSTGCPYISPWLMFPRDKTYNFVDPVHDNETYLMSFCEFVQGATIRYQKDGWLLMSRKREIFFYNPFTREIIKLPDLPEFCPDISIFCFHLLPTTPHCIVGAIEQNPVDTGMLTIMRGEDIWLPFVSPHKLLPLHGTAPIYYNGVFYCVDCDGTLGALDPMKDDCWSVLATPKKIFNNDMHPNLLVECGGDVLLVKLGHLGTAVRVFRLDFSEMEWVKVESLGKHMLFISETSCLSVVAPNSQMENTICFPRLCLNGEGILIYSLETGSYRCSSSGKNQHSLNSFYATEGWLSNCTWIQPNWSKSTEQMLDWLNPLGSKPWQKPEGL